MKTQTISLMAALAFAALPSAAALACTAAPPAVWHDDLLFPGQALPIGSRIYLDSQGAPATELTLTRGDSTVVLQAQQELSNLGQHTNDYARFVTVFVPTDEVGPGTWQVTPGGGVGSDDELSVTFSAEVDAGGLGSAPTLTSSVVSWVYHEANNCSEYNNMESDPTPSGNSFRVDVEFDLPAAPSAGWVAQVLHADTGTLAAIIPMGTAAGAMKATYFVPETESLVCFDTRILSPLGVEVSTLSSCVTLNKDDVLMQAPIEETPSPTPSPSDSPTPEDDEDGAACDQGAPSSAATSAAALFTLLLGLGLRRRG